MSRADQAEQRKATRLRFVPVAVGMGLVLGLAGCGSGQIAQTATEVAAVNGASGQAGPIGIRDALLAAPMTADGSYPQGANANLLVTIVNTGNTSDKLVSVASPFASSVQVSGQTDLSPGTAVSSSTTANIAAHHAALPSTGESSSAAPSSSASANSSATPSSSASASPPAPLTYGQISIVLVSLTQPVKPGMDVPVTFLFANAGQVTIQVPMAMPTSTTSSTTTASSSAGH